MNFASWYSPEFPKEDRKDWFVKSSHYGYSHYEPVEISSESISECHQKIGIEYLVNDICAGMGVFQTYLLKGGVMFTIIHSREDFKKKGIEMASHSPSKLFDEIVRLGLPLMLK